MPPPPSATALPYIANTAAAISLIPTISGAAFLLKPSAGLKQFNLPGPTTEKELGLFQMYACRQCAAGLTTLAMWWTGSYRAMGLAGLAGALIAVTDGLVAKRLVDEKEAWKHWGAVPVGLGLTAGLLYYTL